MQKQSQWYFFTCLMLFVVLGTSGCVYLRLLKVQRQFREFERYVQLENIYGLALTFSQPVLSERDVVWLMKGGPPIQACNGRYAVFKYDFRKRYAEGTQQEMDLIPIGILLHFHNNRLYKIRFSKEFSAFLQPELLMGTLRSMGKGSVDQKNRSLSATLHTGQTSDANQENRHQSEYVDKDRITTPIDIPTRTEIKNILGVPYHLTESASHVMLYYEYEVTVKSDKAQQPAPTVRIWLYFSPDNEQLTAAKVMFHGMTTAIRFQ